MSAPSPLDPAALPPGSKIVHVDMDAFYASVEQRDRPELRGRPVAVGRQPGGRGVVAAASYEARRFGIRSALPMARALRLCPELVVVPPDFEKYTAISRQLRQIFYGLTPLVEPVALDEAFLDVTKNARGEPSAGRLARWLKQEIWSATGLKASAGVGPNKLIAKLASDYDKPDGLVIVPPERVQDFLRPLEVRRIWGVGPKTAERLAELGVTYVSELQAVPAAQLEAMFGKLGPILAARAQGEDPRPVVPHREAKSHGAERTLARDLHRLEEVRALIERLSQKVAEDLKGHGTPGYTVSLKLRYNDFRTISRSFTGEAPTDQPRRIAQIAFKLLESTEAGRRPVRLVGVQVHNLVRPDQMFQLELDLEAGDPGPG